MTFKLNTCYKGSGYYAVCVQKDATARVAGTPYLFGGKIGVALRDSAAGANSSIGFGGEWQAAYTDVGVAVGVDVTAANLGFTSNTTVVGFVTSSDGANATTIKLWG